MRSAKEIGLLSCRICQQIHMQSMELLQCTRCGHRLRQRETNSVTRSWMILAIALMAYVLAGLLPLGVVQTLEGADSRSIVSSVGRLWMSGKLPIALLVLASGLVFPLLKIAALATLLLSVRHRSIRRRRHMTKMHRALDVACRCSMPNMLAAVLPISFPGAGPVVAISPGPGMPAFAAVSILTTIAFRIFDSRLLWDPPEEHA